MPRIKNLAGYFSGEGFLKKQGRRISLEDAAFVEGPVDLCFSSTTHKITQESTDDIVIDGSGLVATAGFVDSHTHSLFAGDRSAEYFMRWAGKSYKEISDAGGGIKSTFTATQKASDELIIQELKRRLKEMLSWGTTSVEIKSGYGKDSAEELRILRLLKKAQEIKEIPDFYTTFLALHSLPPGKTEESYILEMKSILPVVVAEKLAQFVDAFPEDGFFSLAGSLDFIREARKKGLLPKIHADEITDMRAAEHFILEEAVSIDHLQRINESGRVMLSLNKTVGTLLPATSFYLDLPYANARALIDEGARIALASDFNPGTAPRLDLQFTALLAASKLRMTEAEILCALTFNGAAALGLTDRGVLMPGWQADILLWNLGKKDKLQELLAKIILNAEKPERVIHSKN